MLYFVLDFVLDFVFLGLQLGEHGIRRKAVGGSRSRGQPTAFFQSELFIVVAVPSPMVRQYSKEREEHRASEQDAKRGRYGE